MQFSPSGSFVALVTPFQENGNIDWKALEGLVAWHIQEGSDGLVCCATTGESLTLSDAEKKRVISFCAERAAGKISIVANSGTAGTLHSVRLSEQLLRCGANAVLAVTPYYNKPSQRGSILHFTEIAKAGAPVIVYNNPGRSGVLLYPETIAEIGQLQGIAGYKDSTGDLHFIRTLRKISSIPILSGDDSLTLDTLKEGGVGAISVIGNLFPNAWKKMIYAGMDQQWEEAGNIAQRLLPLCKAMFLESNPQCVKFALHLLGRCQKALRLPLVIPEASTQKEIISALEQATRNQKT